jgi:tetratricopeptide (TPR) repeat protein
MPAPMIDQRVEKNAACDRLMKEGLDGRQDLDAVIRTATLTDLAIELGRKDGLACALAWCEALEKKPIPGDLAILVDYNRANAIAGERYGTEWHWDQPTLASELFYLRRAISHEKFAETPDTIRCMCLNNIGNRMDVAGRAIEALEYWRRALEVQPNFGMALCNRAKILADYAMALEEKIGGNRLSFSGWLTRKRQPPLRRQRPIRMFVMNAIGKGSKRSRTGSNPLWTWKESPQRIH